MDGTISRVSYLSDYNGADVNYSYLGLGTSVRQYNHNTPGLSYVRALGEGLSDSQDPYTGLDRFGRVIQQRWSWNLWVTGTQSGDSVGGATTDDFQYAYDRNANVLFKDNLLSGINSELYHSNGIATNSSYDPLNRLTNFSRGTLSASGNNGSTLDQISSPGTTNNWNLDALGNWTSTQGGSQTRTFNSQNQILSISGQTTPTYDNNGNMTRDQAANAYTFDAWNHIVSVNGTYSYKYDALGRRIYEGTTGHDLYFDGSNVIEERSGGTVTTQYVWNADRPNSLFCRDDNSTSGSLGISGSGLGRRLFVQQDVNTNVTALADTSGNVVQRFVYDPYGTKTPLDANWNALGGDTVHMLYGYQAGRTDPVSGKVHFGYRDLNTGTGAWMQQDPAGYVNGANLYQIEIGDPTRFIDPSGTASAAPITGTLPGSGGSWKYDLHAWSHVKTPDGTVKSGAYANIHFEPKGTCCKQLAMLQLVRTSNNQTGKWKQGDWQLDHLPNPSGNTPNPWYTNPLLEGTPWLSQLYGSLGHTGTDLPGAWRDVVLGDSPGIPDSFGGDWEVNFEDIVVCVDTGQVLDHFFWSYGRGSNGNTTAWQMGNNPGISGGDPGQIIKNWNATQPPYNWVTLRP